MITFNILSYIGLCFILILFIYLTLKLLGIVGTIGVEEILWGFVGSRLYFDLLIERRLSRIEGR
jgi:hypothetical protein